MILFVFEGERREPALYDTIKRLYFPGEDDSIVCSFGNNIYELYKELKKLNEGADIVAVMKERLHKRGDDSLSEMRSADFAEIYLFFDYEFQNKHLSVAEMNRRISDMLTLFDEETECGKLYINYPMVESIRYVKSLPDEDYAHYTVTRAECADFKQLSASFSCFKSFDFIQFKEGEQPTEERYSAVSRNWECLKAMNVCKANLLVSGHNAMPADKSAISQAAVFKAQREQYVDKEGRVAVLNSFPLFIYEYLK